MCKWCQTEPENLGTQILNRLSSKTTLKTIHTEHSFGIFKMGSNVFAL